MKTRMQLMIDQMKPGSELHFSGDTLGVHVTITRSGGQGTELKFWRWTPGDNGAMTISLFRTETCAAY